MTRFEEMIDEVRLLWHVIVQVSSRLHAKESITPGMRAVLEYLAGNGATTVPQIARSRRVTRQHIQGLVNALLERKLAIVEENPAHRRSILVRLTSQGERAIGRMKRREQRFLERLELGVTAAELGRTAETLREVRATLEHSPFHGRLEAGRSERPRGGSVRHA